MNNYDNELTIKNKSKQNQWQHVPSSTTVACKISMGISASQLLAKANQ